MRASLRWVSIGAGVALCCGAAGVVSLRHMGGDDPKPVAQVAPVAPDPTAVGPSGATPAAMSAASAGSAISRAAASAAPTKSVPGKPAAKPRKRTAAGTAQEPAPAGSTSCSNPRFTTSDPNGGWSTNGYYVHNNMWNAGEGGPETLRACAYNNWYVTSTQPNSTSVKTYPNVHKDYDNVAISSFNSLRSSFAATSPHVGIYNVAYDLWLNGVATDGSTEVMIWTENYRQVPGGSKVTTTSFGGRTYDVWKRDGNSYIAFVPRSTMTSGSLDLLQMFRWMVSKGWLESSATVGQIDYGVEICSTNNRPATFRFTDFSISES